MKMETRISVSVISFSMAALFFWAVLFRNHLPAVTDVFSHLYPDRVFTLDQFRRGWIPLWNPWIGCGTPQAANWISSCFYPFFWVWDFLGSPDSLTVICIFHSAAAFAGFYLWLRLQKVSSAFSALGALSFAGSGLFVRCWAYPHHMAALTWIPWIFASVQRVLKDRTRLNQGLVVLFLSLQILAGYPIFVFYTWVFLSLWFFRQNPKGKEIRSLGLALFTALGMTALQWIPFGEFLTGAGRGGWAEFPYFDRWTEVLTLFNPGILGVPGSSQYQGSASNSVFNLYFGLIPLAVLAFGWLLPPREKSESVFWKYASWVCLFWMLGSHFPLWKMIPEKGLEALEPSKAVSLFIFSASTYAALRLDQGWSLSKNFKKYFWLAGIGLVWTLDILAVPFQITHPISNIYHDPALIEKSRQIRQTLQGRRILSLSRQDRLTFTGQDRLEKSVAAPVQSFLPDSGGVWGIRSVDYYLSIWPEGLQNILRYIQKGFPYPGDLLDIAGVRLILIPQSLPPKNTNPRESWGITSFS